MMHEYRDWCKEHPDATEEEKREVWNRLVRRLEVRAMVGEMLVAYR